VFTSEEAELELEELLEQALTKGNSTKTTIKTTIPDNNNVFVPFILFSPVIL
jgi:hypothetical protein